MKVGYVYDPIYLKHDPGDHPESPQRLEAIMAHLKETKTLDLLVPVTPRPATMNELELVHRLQHITRVQEMALRGGGWLDSDTAMSADSYEAALYAAGGTIVATEAVVKGEIGSAFALVRPPGHHATPARAMGFCLFNNIAIAAKYALANLHLERVLIIDFDVHHGNGTQDAFYDDPRGVYISTHEFPFYPGTGGYDETGTNGNIINIPLPAGSSDADHMLAFNRIVVPAARRFKPQLILVSAGYDSHWADQLAMMQVSITGYAEVMRVIKELADELCGGRLVLALEGGYNLTALAASVKATFDMLLGKTGITDPLGPSPRRYKVADIDVLVEKIREIHKLT
jgi:acetoin utilization deacetylase AcuC-like enzyme